MSLKPSFPRRLLRRLLGRARPEASPAAAAAWTDEDEERRTFYAAFVHPGDLVFDVGANLGNRTRVFLALGARVVAFEPQQACAGHLRAAFGARAAFTLDTRALGREPGEQDMLLSDTHVLSTLSPAWIDATRQSGRFAAYTWEGRQRVPVTTLDAAIAAYGRPAFVKVDVEGYELPVVQGLSTPVNALSLEFAAEHLDEACRCIDHLAGLAPATFQFSRAESMQFELPGWVDADAMKDLLATWTRQDPLTWGDVYLRGRVAVTT